MICTMVNSLIIYFCPVSSFYYITLFYSQDFPLAPEQLEITKDMISDYTRRHCSGRPSKCKKLTPNLMSKTKYVVHYRNLKFYLEKVRALSFIFFNLKQFLLFSLLVSRK